MDNSQTTIAADVLNVLKDKNITKKTNNILSKKELLSQALRQNIKRRILARQKKYQEDE